ncbi:MAG: xylose isomerase [Candidatus Infernicultor aquiphilus]|uniref:Xylose isomerase n=1 Tax=Candidatus Infernicultor aquiphilus TaxID=1805029 RepID=A0A2M7PRR2_9BACT|nr:MAG: xylose isomerase [Candidatus Atribacteria bacterium CG_4_10_14_3_um_filter_34_13]
MMERSRFSLNRIIYPDLNLEDFFKFTADLGLNKVELRNDLPGKGVIDTYSPEEIKDLLKKYDLEILTINALQKFNLGVVLQQAIKELKELINLSLSIGCKAIVLCPNNEVNDRRNSKEFFKETVGALKSFAPLFEESNLWGYVEPLGFKESSLCSLVTAMNAIKEAGCPNYKIVYDTFHHYIGPDTFDIIENKYNLSYTGLVHISGVESVIPTEQYRDNHRILVSVQDKLKSKEQIELLIKLGYNGDISLEPFAKEVQKMEIEEIKSAIDKSIEYIVK